MQLIKSKTDMAPPPCRGTFRQPSPRHGRERIGPNENRDGGLSF
jgi:hypothetical protein